MIDKTPPRAGHPILTDPFLGERNTPEEMQGHMICDITRRNYYCQHRVELSMFVSSNSYPHIPSAFFFDPRSLEIIYHYN